MENTKTKWEGQNRSFKGDLRFGKLCEDVIRRFLMHYVDVDDVRDISNSNRGIKDDIDFEIVYRDGHTCQNKSRPYHLLSDRDRRGLRTEPS